MTEFQAALFQALASVPYGYVISYGELARRAGFPGYHRQVARALAQLPNHSTLPWHRCLLASGHLGNFANRKIQKQLLQQEGARFNGQKLQNPQWFKDVPA